MSNQPVEALVAQVSPTLLKPRARFVLDADALAWIYPDPVRRQIESLVEIVGDPCTAEDVRRDPSILNSVELMFSGWAAPVLTAELLEQAPDLKAVFYGAGASDYFQTPASIERGIQVTSSISMNALPVIEFTVAQVVMCLKRVWQHVFELRRTRQWQQSEPGASGYRSQVGLVSLGHIGRGVAERLAMMDVDVVAYDIHWSEPWAQTLGIRRVDLQTLFQTSDVVSIHTPLVDQTRQMISKQLLEQMKPGASLINTSRGGLIDEPALLDLLAKRQDLLAVLDVTEPEPPAEDSLIWSLENVVLTPHIAGSRGRECERMGVRMVEQLKQYLDGKPIGDA